MTKKDYVAIAARIKDVREAYRVKNDGRALAGAAEVAISLSTIFAEDNPRFDRSRFLGACGVVE